MVQLALKALLLLSLGQYFAMGGERKRQGLQRKNGDWCSWCPIVLPAHVCWSLCRPHLPTHKLPKLAKDIETFYQPRQLRLDYIRKIFNVFDADKDGCLTYEEFRKMRPEIPEQEAKRIFAKTDKNNDKCIDFSEFSEL